MEDMMQMPVLRQAHDTFRLGIRPLKEELKEGHPVQKLELKAAKSSWVNKMATVERIYGKGLSMRLQAEKDVMQSIQRFHGLPSSRVALETVMGTDVDIGVQDVLNDPYENPEVTFHLHEAMEIKYGLL